MTRKPSRRVISFHTRLVRAGVQPYEILALVLEIGERSCKLNDTRPEL